MKKLGFILIAIIILPMFFGKWLVSIYILLSIFLLPIIAVLITYLLLGGYMGVLKMIANYSTRKVDKLAKEIAKEQLIIARKIEELDGGTN